MLQQIISYVNFHFPQYFPKDWNDSFIKSRLVYRYLHEKYFKKIMNMNPIMFRLNDGLVDLLFQSRSNVLKNHLIFSYAFSELYDRYKKGRGRVYVANTKLKKSSIIGFFTGIIYCFFHKGVI